MGRPAGENRERPTFDVVGVVGAAAEIELMVACQLCGHVRTYEYHGCENQGHADILCDCRAVFVGKALDAAESEHDCPEAKP